MLYNSESLMMGDSQNARLDSGIALSKTPYFENAPTLGLLPYPKFFDTLMNGKNCAGSYNHMVRTNKEPK
jgi:hypothetical protein